MTLTSGMTLRIRQFFKFSFYFPHLIISALAIGLCVPFFSQSALVAQELIPHDLPLSVHIKTPTETFTHQFEIALRRGEIWIRLLNGGQWRLLHIQRGTPKDGFVQISADGDNLVAMDGQGLVYYTKLSQLKKWQMLWGLPFGQRLYLPKNCRAFAISHRGPVVKQYEDIHGNVNPVSAGVSTFYTLSANGQDIYYADPWLNHGFSWHLDTPLRGQFVASNLSASASTLFVVDKKGRMFTRLADFDTIGDNWVLPYSYEPSTYFLWWKTRGLPGEGWVQQPSIPEGGKVTKNITIIQSGVGNASRELRIEGVDAEGNTGYYSKPIFDPQWVFIRTGGLGLLPSSSFLDPNAVPEIAPSRDQHYSGRVKKWAGQDQPHIELLDFNLFSSPATLRLWMDSGYVDLKLHTRRLSLSQSGRKATLVGAIQIPEEHRMRLAHYFHHQAFVQIENGVKDEQLIIKNLTLIPRPWRRLEIHLSKCRI